MAQHVEPCAGGNGLWLPLTEYSVRSGVSLSTIRRKIKSNTITFRLEKGRYLILFDSAAPPAVESAPPVQHKFEIPRTKITPAPQRNPMHSDGLGTNNTGAVQMISDAFEHVLKEKEERVRLLEQQNQELQDQINELRLLVRVLEEKYEVRY